MKRQKHHIAKHSKAQTKRHPQRSRRTTVIVGETAPDERNANVQQSRGMAGRTEMVETDNRQSDQLAELREEASEEQKGE